MAANSRPRQRLPRAHVPARGPAQAPSAASEPPPHPLRLNFSPLTGRSRAGAPARRQAAFSRVNGDQDPASAAGVGGSGPESQGPPRGSSRPQGRGSETSKAGLGRRASRRTSGSCVRATRAGVALPEKPPPPRQRRSLPVRGRVRGHDAGPVRREERGTAPPPPSPGRGPAPSLRGPSPPRRGPAPWPLPSPLRRRPLPRPV